MDLIEAEDIKKKLQEYTEELSKKDLHDPDNHKGVITHLLICFNSVGPILCCIHNNPLICFVHCY